MFKLLSFDIIYYVKFWDFPFVTKFILKHEGEFEKQIRVKYDLRVILKILQIISSEYHHYFCVLIYTNTQ